MIWKVTGAIVVLALGIAIYGLVVVGGQESSPDKQKSVQKTGKQEEVWDGRGEHIYRMELPDSSGVLIIDRASFSGLRQSRATAIVRMVYEGTSIPKWLRGKQVQKSFQAFYQNSDDDLQYKLVRGPLEDGRAVIDFTLRNVPSVRLDSVSPKGVFIKITGFLPRGESFYLRISVAPEPGYSLG